MTPRHLVTSYPRTASPPPPADRRGVITLVTSVTRRPVAGCHVSRVTWREHCHQTVTGDQVPGVTTDGESRGESHSHITVTRHTGHTAAGHTLSRSVTRLVPLTCWLHAAARSCGVAGRGKTEQLRGAAQAAAVYTPAAHWAVARRGSWSHRCLCGAQTITS